MSKKYLLLFALGVSACGGGGDSGVGFNTFAQLANESSRLQDKLVGDTATTADDLPGVPGPVGGTGTYRGVMSLVGENGTSSDISFLGAVDMSVNFDTEDLNGTATNFWRVVSSSSATPVEGTISLTANTFIYDNPATTQLETFPTAVTGTLNVDGVSGVETITPGTNIPTAFAGANPNAVDMIAGSDDGGVTSDVTVVFSDGSRFDPVFLVD